MEILPDSAFHIFGTCDAVVRIWAALGITSAPGSFNDVVDWFFHMLAVLKGEVLDKFLMVCWGVWRSRNQYVWEGVVFNSDMMLRRTLSFWQGWKHANETEQADEQVQVLSRWKPPQSGRWKLNTDASVNAAAGITGIGWVLRGHDGGFMAAKNVRFEGVYTINEAEAIAVREAFSWFKDTGMGDVDVETDSQTVFHSLFQHSFNSTFGLLIDDIKELAMVVDDVQFHFVKRSANTASHVVAREACSGAD
ncbi:PREDICTED: uncharacterized protein LOC109191235 [Ipomoea nil]|uniref:uncharacterized protein LOC109191235 n=1 Tax=Ipomoea nil TaxID=35883 RepID=UPI000901685A|nr:PREDICTED: uncharacterized protein LOC109191235 [Ipomoea nil]